MLQLFVGGDSALLDRCRPVLEVIADPQRITHAGGNGSGYLTKLLVNLLWFGQAVATGEALLLAGHPGLTWTSCARRWRAAPRPVPSS